MNRIKRVLYTLIHYPNFATGTALVILCIVFGFSSPYFFTWINLMSIGTYASIMGTMAAGLTVAMLLGGIDVSQYAMSAFLAMVMGLLYQAKVPSGLIVVLIILASGVCGLFNSFVIVKMNIAPMIATMGLQFVYRGLAYIITDGANIRLQDDVFRFIGKGNIGGVVPCCLVIMLVVYVVIWYLLTYTPFGRNVYAVGGNIRAAKLSGIETNKVRIMAHTIAAITAGIGAIIIAGQVACCMPKQGEGNDMDGIAAVVLGGVGLSGGKGNIWGTLIGVLILSVLLNGMTLLNVQPYWQRVIKGFVLIFAVYIDSVRSMQRNRPAKA